MLSPPPPKHTSNEIPTIIYLYAIIKVNENRDAFASVVTSVKIQAGASVNKSNNNGQLEGGDKYVHHVWNWSE